MMADIVVVGSGGILRAGLVGLLRELGFNSVQEAEDIQRLKTCSTAAACSNALILCVAREPKEIARLLDDLQAWAWSAKVVFVAGEFDLDTMQQCFAGGAAGYLLETILPDALMDSLNLVKAGEKVFPSQLATLLPLLACHPDNPPSKSSVATSAELSDEVHLTAQEKKILMCLVQGQANKMIARSLHIAESTVKIHIKHILRKTGLGNRTQLALFAVAKEVRR
jgi:two-component system nitrate/nitrite response regulator NarL